MATVPEKHEAAIIRERLFQSEERFRLLVESVQDYAVILLDRDGFIQSWNRGAERVKGWSANEIVGQHFTRFYPPEDVANGKPARLLAMAERDGRVEDEGWRMRKSGTRFWANVIITALRDPNGQLVGFGKVTRDLTERRNAEDALRRSEERFRTMISTVRDYAIFMLDPDGHVASWNEGAQRIKGYAPEEIIGKHFSTFYGEEDLATRKPWYELRVAAAEGRFEDEGWRIRKDGSRFWANVVITALRDPGGKLIGFTKVTRDLTERRRAEEDRVERARIEAALRARDEFLATASHELRTPLSTLKLQADSLKRSLDRTDGDPPRERVLGRLETIRKQIGRLELLISELLDVSRITAGRLELEHEPVDLLVLVHDAIDRLSDPLEAAGCAITFEHDAGVIVVADRTRLEQAVTNLLTNAMKYGQGKPIEIEVRKTETSARIAVRDHGIGIDPAQHHRIFERFERTADARHFAGLGLGLWIAKQIVQAHGGSISVDSRLGEGARFCIDLPRGAR